MIYVGTSGYGYHDWSPGFYPPGLSYDRYLDFYSRRFDCCEINRSFFELPDRSFFERLVADPGTGRALIFTVKAPRRLTHERAPELLLARHFASTLEPLVESERLGGVLAQFPFSFLNNPDNRAYVCRLRAAMNLPLAAEFRHDSWTNRETLDFLRGWGIGLVCSDLPELGHFPGPRALATSDIGYVRLHGRRSDVWWRRNDAGRYDYRYRHRELVAWVPRAREIARHTRHLFIIFNNHPRGQAVQNAASFRGMLEAQKRRRRQSPTPAA